MPLVEIPSDIPEDIVVAYARCHQLENWLREMVYLETKAAFGVRYWEECDGALKHIKASGISPGKSIKSDHRYPHMATEENDPVWFTSFDTLLKIIFETSMWPLFEKYLTAREILEPKMTEISMIRNRVAHCRGLHKHDMDRLLLILRELDPGIFKLCSTYGDAHRFYSDDLQKNFIHRYFQTEEGPWLRSDSRVRIDVKWSIRPWADWGEAFSTGRGLFYHFTFYTALSDNHYFDYRNILEGSSWIHKDLAHLILDDQQRRLEIRVPAVLEQGVIVKHMEYMHTLCANVTTYQLISRLRGLERLPDEEPAQFDRRQFTAQWRIFEEIALEWPHYVIPPTHGFAILDSSTPATMFGA